MTHTIEVSISADHGDGVRHMSRISVCGDGSLDHALDTFRAALVADGIAASVAERLDVAAQRYEVAGYLAAGEFWPTRESIPLRLLQSPNEKVIAVYAKVDG
jgi:hypothetical protein